MVFFKHSYKVFNLYLNTNTTSNTIRFIVIILVIGFFFVLCRPSIRQFLFKTLIVSNRDGLELILIIVSIFY